MKDTGSFKAWTKHELHKPFDCLSMGCHMLKNEWYSLSDFSNSGSVNGYKMALNNDTSKLQYYQLVSVVGEEWSSWSRGGGRAMSASGQTMCFKDIELHQFVTKNLKYSHFKVILLEKHHLYIHYSSRVALISWRNVVLTCLHADQRLKRRRKSSMNQMMKSVQNSWRIYKLFSCFWTSNQYTDGYFVGEVFL